MFEGFSEQTIDFLWGIRLNNDRSWFLEHKSVYQTQVYEPMKALGAELAEEMERLYPGEGLRLKVARIYRDVRRVKYGGLYKDHLWLSLRMPTEGNIPPKPTFYFELSPEGYEYGMGYYCARPVDMEQYRRRILRDPKPLEPLARKLNRQDRFHLEGQEYKRSKGTVDPLLQSWFDRKSVSLVSFHQPNERFTTPELKEEILEGFRWLRPYFNYFKAMEQEPPVL